MHQTVLFDLDGTLTDSGLGITNSAMYALAHMGRAVPPREELYCFIGPPLYDSFLDRFGMNEAEVQEAVALFRTYFAEKGLFENEVYRGVPEMLRALKQAGFRLVLATSKPEKWAVPIMEHFGLAEVVPEMAGSTTSPERATKDRVVAYALKKFGIDPHTAIMVGDREHDVLGAKVNGIPTVGVTYGYGSREELMNAGAVCTVPTPEALVNLLLEGRSE